MRPNRCSWNLSIERSVSTFRALRISKVIQEKDKPAIIETFFSTFEKQLFSLSTKVEWSVNAFDHRTHELLQKAVTTKSSFVRVLIIHQSLIFYPDFRLGRVTAEAPLRRFKIPHGFEQPLIVLLAPPQDATSVSLAILVTWPHHRISDISFRRSGIQCFTTFTANYFVAKCKYPISRRLYST